MTILFLTALFLGCWANLAIAEPLTRSAWAARLAWSPKLCPLHAPRSDSTGVVIQAIDSDRRWVIVECQQMAYQGTHLIYLQTSQRASLLQFPQFDTQRDGKLHRYKSALVTGTLEFDPDHAQLQVQRFYRGLGDCGQWLRYEVGSTAPRLTELRVRECADDPGSNVPPGQWPLRKP